MAKTVLQHRGLVKKQKSERSSNGVSPTIKAKPALLEDLRRSTPNSGLVQGFPKPLRLRALPLCFFWDGAADMAWVE